MNDERKLLDAEGIERILTRMAHEILERNKGTKDLAIVGIRTGGAILAKRLQEKILQIESTEIPFGILDITLYRDDIGEISANAQVRGTEITFDLHGKKVIVVDDVLYTGRTIRCALDALIDYGRPQCIRLATLIDRGHRELPIRADYVGKNIPTAPDEDVEVRLSEKDGRDEVVIRRKNS